MHEPLISTLTEQYQANSWTRKDLIQELFLNDEIKTSYPNEIRRATIVGKIANEVLAQVGGNELCRILAIGDIKYFDEMESEWQDIVGKALSSVEISALQGYDLSGLGSAELRKKIAEYMTGYYPPIPSHSLENEIIPSYGGTDSFVTILNTLKIFSAGKQMNFIYPEASFLANIKIAEMFLGEGNCLKLPKPCKNDFFFSSEQIQSLYDLPHPSPLLRGEVVESKTILPSPSRRRVGDEVKDSLNIFYVTPVGNPTGNRVDNENMYRILSEINSLDPNAVFILDTVYVGLLPNNESHKLFAEIFANISLRERIIFTESLSKTLGTTGIRLGWTWTLNSVFSAELKKYTTLTKAGFSKILDEFATNLLSDSRISNFQNRVYDFWSAKRLGFLAHMKTHFPELFDFESSPNITDREGIYVLLKIQGNRSKEEIFSETGIIGVGITLSDGEYIRYAFGNVKEF